VKKREPVSTDGRAPDAGDPLDDRDDAGIQLSDPADDCDHPDIQLNSPADS
jgi:hypothetical protein